MFITHDNEVIMYHPMCLCVFVCCVVGCGVYVCVGGGGCLCVTMFVRMI